MVSPKSIPSPEDIAQNAANAQNPAIVAARADLSSVIHRGERCGYDAEWRRESDAAERVWIQAMCGAGDHRLCYPHHCSAVAS